MQTLIRIAEDGIEQRITDWAGDSPHRLQRSQRPRAIRFAEEIG